MKKKLYEIKQEYVQIGQMLEDYDGEMTEELDELLKINQNELEEKSLGYIVMIKERESNIEMLKNEVKRLQNLIKKEEREKEFFRYGLQEAVNMYGSYKAGTFRVGTRTTYAVSITDEEALDPNFLRLKYEPNKTAIKEAIDAGQEVNGAVIVENKNLYIK